MPWLALADAAARGALVALLLLLVTLLVRDRARVGAAPFATVGAALAVGLVVQVLFGVPAVPGMDAALPWPWLALLVGVSVANSLLFWLFVQALFDDDFHARAWHAGLWAAVVAVAALGAAFCGPNGVSGVNGVSDGGPLDPPVLLAALQGGLPLVFGLLALWAAARQWRADLVEGRRRLRWFVVAAGVFDTVAMVVARLVTTPGHVTPLAAWLDVVMLLVIVAVVAVHLLQLGDLGVLAGAARPTVVTAGLQAQPQGPTRQRPSTEPLLASPPPPDLAVPTADDPAEGDLAEALAQAMAVEHLYRDDALSVASLSGHLRVPEYRLRRVINQRLGFRNFNAYVNGHRVAAAREALADPQRRDEPVLTIALAAGFASIGPFNRAFKAETGLTPSEFRRQSPSPLADS